MEGCQPAQVGSSRPGWRRVGAGATTLRFSVYQRLSHALSPSSPGNSTRSWMLAWSSLSRTSHLSSLPTITFLHSGRWPESFSAEIRDQPVVEIEIRSRQERKQRPLIDDTGIERRRLKE